MNFYSNYMEAIENDGDGVVRTVFKEIKNKPMEFIKAQWTKFKETFRPYESEICAAFNKYYHTSISSFNEIDNNEKRAINEEADYTESLKGFWEVLKQEMFPTLSFYPALQVWLAIDEIIKKNDISIANIKTIVVYSIFWMALMAGRQIKRSFDAKKEEEEDEARREELKKKMKPRIQKNVSRKKAV